MWRPYRRRTQPNLAAGEVSIDELAAMVGLKPRALRIWMKAGVLPRGERRGRYLGYGEAIQLRARAAAVLVRRSRRLEDVVSALEGLDEAGLRELAGLPEPEVEPAAAQPGPPPASASAEPAAAGQADAEPPTHESIPDEGLSAPPDPASSAAAGADSDWRSIPLVAGLELRVRRDAPPLVQRIAESIARGDWLP